MVVKEIGETAMKQNKGHIGNIEPKTKTKSLCSRTGGGASRVQEAFEEECDIHSDREDDGGV